MKLNNIELTFENFANEMAKLKNEKHFDYLVTIIVEAFQVILRQVVIFYVVLQHGLVFRHVVADAHRQGETHVAVYLCLVAESEGGHGTERVYKTVVAGDFTVQLRDVRSEWHRAFAEMAELVGCLMACVSKVENIFRLLRIKHEGILIAL